jgi:hypothetical protein
MTLQLEIDQLEDVAPALREHYEPFEARFRLAFDGLDKLKNAHRQARTTLTASEARVSARSSICIAAACGDIGATTLQTRARSRLSRRACR